MSIAAISPPTARVLLRIRWLAWGAIAALLALHALAAFNQPQDLKIAPRDQFADHHASGGQ